MVAATARRAVLRAARLAALLALPNAAARRAAVALVRRLPRRALRDAHVPLDRAGATRARSTCAIGRTGRDVRADADVPLRRPGRRRAERDARASVGGLPELEDRLQLIGYDQRGTGRSGCCAARGWSATRTCATPPPPRSARTGSASRAATTRRRTRSQDMEAIRAELGVEKLTLSGSPTAPSWRSPTRAPTRTRRAADPRLRRRRRRRRPVLHRHVPRDGSVAAVAVPAPLPRRSPDPGADLGKLVAQAAGEAAADVAYDARGRSHRVKIGPTTCWT